jgi:enoyl-CoA hydratase
MSANDEIIFTVKGPIGHVMLNRPKALNALTHEMCLALDAKLQVWEMDLAVKAVVIEGAGEKAFCAGGDIVKLYNEGKSGGDYPIKFYRDEYLCNTRIKHFSKPYIALIDGIVMGGGVGVSVHGSHRVATERTMFAMPESGIGLFPDVGGSYFLPRCPGEMGMYLGLTGARLKGMDAVSAGVADALVPSDKLPDLVAALSTASFGEDIETEITAIIAQFAETAETDALNDLIANVARHFDKSSVENIIESLEADNDPWAEKALATLSIKSPTSLKISHEQLRRGAALEFDDCMRMEFRMVNRVIAGVDFYEGTRAAVIDKDQSPIWKPATLAEVSDADVAAYFAPLDTGELY